MASYFALSKIHTHHGKESPQTNTGQKSTKRPIGGPATHSLMWQNGIHGNHGKMNHGILIRIAEDGFGGLQPLDPSG
jgi:hypothetical protein